MAQGKKATDREVFASMLKRAKIGFYRGSVYAKSEDSCAGCRTISIPRYGYTIEFYFDRATGALVDTETGE